MAGNLIDLPSIDWTPQEWREQATCKGEPTEIWFATQGHGVKVAKRICGTCPVRLECLQWAVEEQINHGIFGGRTPRERRMLRRGNASLAVCGTMEGANLHLDAGEDLCPACLGVRRDRARLAPAKARYEAKKREEAGRG